jgi:hypothetical protein
MQPVVREVSNSHFEPIAVFARPTGAQKPQLVAMPPHLRRGGMATNSQNKNYWREVRLSALSS